MRPGSTITDDRGREHRAARVPIPKSFGAEAADLAMTDASTSTGVAWWTASVVLSLIMAMGCCITTAPPGGVAAFLGTLAACGVARSRSPSRRRARWAMEGVCRSCGYACDGLARDGKGRVRCPECGARGIPGLAGGVTGLDRSALAAWLLADVCPCCGYELAGLREGEDGCVECPECGAAWGLARWKRDHPPFVRSTLEAAGIPAGHVTCWLRDARGRDVEVMPRAATGAAVLRAGRRMLVAFAASGALVLFAVVFLMVAQTPLEAVALLATVLASVLGLACFEVRRGELIADRRRLAGEELVAGQCPRCATPLPEDRAVSDGALVCGRCGAAWPDRRGDPIPPAPPPSPGPPPPPPPSG